MRQKTKISPSMSPQLTLGRLVAHAVEDLYGLKWHPRVVRLRNKRIASSLQFIDYVIPCFELGQKLQTSPQKITKEIAAYLEDNRAKTVGLEIHDSFQAEAVNGYLNFRLADEYLTKAVEAAAQWFESPIPVGKQVRSKFLVIGPPLANGEEFYTVDTVNSYIHNLYNLLGNGPTTTFLMNDYSEEAATYLATYLENSLKSTSRLEAKKTPIHRQVKRALAKNSADPTTKNILKILGEIRTEWLASRKELLSDLKIKDYSVILESDIANKVHEYLDRQLTYSDQNNIVFDTGTSAVYYDDPTLPVALRSIDGLLYKPAYVMFALKHLLAETHQNGQKVLVIIAPQKMHQLIYDHTSFLTGNNGFGTEIVCFDPLVSRADILEIQESILSFRDHFQQIAQTLVTSKIVLNQEHKRKELLSLVDTPIELTDFVARQQLPAIFDLVNQTTTALNSLND